MRTLAVNANAAKDRGKFGIIGENGPAIAKTAKRLCRKKAGCGGKSKRAERTLLIGRPKALGRVVKHKEVLSFHDLADCIVIRWLAKQVDWNDRPGSQPKFPGKCDSTLERGDINIKGL